MLLLYLLILVSSSLLAVVLGFDVNTVDVLDSHVVAFYLALYLVVGAALNLLGGIETHVDVVLLVLPVLQEVSTELVHFMNQM